ncbi:MAG: SH3 domain-containing protein [Alkalilacustris sp.]
MSRIQPRSLLPALALLLAMAPRPAATGDVAACFVPGAGGSCVQPVLQHVEFKSVVAEFVWPAPGGLGHSLSRYLWREVLDSVFDLRGAGVILAHDREQDMRRALDGRDPREFLETHYHDAALAITRAMEAQMGLWGVVLADGADSVFIQTYLTLLPGEEETWTRLRLGSTTPGTQEALSVDIARGRLAFAPARADRATLFARRFATRCALRGGCPGGVPLRAMPSNDAPIRLRVPEHSSVAVEDMVEQWMRVRLPDGEAAWINIYHVHVTPPAIHTPGRRVNLRTAPGGEILAVTDFAGSYAVQDVTLEREGRRWFRIDSDAGEGWVAGWLFEPDYLFPMVHLVEGLYRYARHDFTRAARAFERFIERGAETESNVTLAAAHRFLAAARLAADPSGGPRAALQALDDLDAAATLTPFDPNLRLMRALVSFGVLGGFGDGLADLAVALDLDDRHPATRAFLEEVLRTARQSEGPVALNGGIPPPADALEQLESLAASASTQPR